MVKTVNILNKRAKFDYEILETYTAGIVLTGTEIKSIRLGKANITESFCEFSNNELFAINTYIEEYAFGNQFNHKARSERKLLLNKRELRGLAKSVQVKGLTADKHFDYIEPHVLILVPMKELPSEQEKKDIYEPVSSKLLQQWAAEEDEHFPIVLAHVA